MLQLHYKTMELPFEFPFEHAKGRKTIQKTFVVSLGLGRYRGFGEMTEIAYYPESELHSTVELLESKRLVIERYAINAPDRFFHFLHHLIPENTFLMSALDTAAWDLWAKMNGKSVRQLMGHSGEAAPVQTSYTIGIQPRETVEEILNTKVFPCYKIKVRDEADWATVHMVLDRTEATVRIDANESWNLEGATAFHKEFAGSRIELIEQPFPRGDWESMKRWRPTVEWPIIADESCRHEEDLERCLDAFDGVNIKLSKFGGISPSLELAKKIKDRGQKVMLGGMCESAIGTTATAQLVDYADYVDLDGPLLLRENFGTGVTYDSEGMLRLPAGAGLGLSFR